MDELSSLNPTTAAYRPPASTATTSAASTIPLRLLRCLRPQHFLNFFLLPHVQTSLRPGLFTMFAYLTPLKIRRAGAGLIEPIFDCACMFWTCRL